MAQDPCKPYVLYKFAKDVTGLMFDRSGHFVLFSEEGAAAFDAARKAGKSERAAMNAAKKLAKGRS